MSRQAPLLRRFGVLLDGINHVAVITDDTDRFVRFYKEVFDATVSHRRRFRSGD
jgi:hypothetical protein